jgi:hypothetical protein
MKPRSKSSAASRSASANGSSSRSTININRQTQDLVLVDPLKLLWHIQKSAMSKTRFADEMDLGRTSLYRILQKEPIKRSTALALARRLGIELTDLLESTEVDGSPEALTSSWQHPEWQVVPGTLMPLRAMSNGLIMRVAQVRHRVLPNEFGRGKVYDLAGMPAALRQQCREALSRHAVVCRRLADCPFVAKNLTMTALQDDTLWTAVDAWFESRTLAELLQGGPLPVERIGQVMADACAAIAALHAQQIVLRELHPESILVRTSDGRCLLTDLELAKLLEVDATVSSRWQPNPYRAPEVAGGESRPQADVHSAARLLVRLVAGTLPDYPEDAQILEQSLPAGPLRSTLCCALSPNWKKRPQSIATLRELLPELGGSGG